MTDKQIQQAVIAAAGMLGHAAEIGVTVIDGVIGLFGCVNSQTEKLLLEQAAKSVYGVRAVVDDLEILSGPSGEHPDLNTALEAVWAIEAHNSAIPSRQIQLTVRNGWITLEGEVDWWSQREAAEAVVGDLGGVRGITNHIVVRSHVSIADVKHQIEEALLQVAEEDAERISVSTSNSRLILKGSVRAEVEREEAAQAAWQTPGITEVENNIAVCT